MSISVFPDKSHQPSTEELLAVLGSKRSLWERLTQFILDNYQIPGELSFGGKKYGWNVWYRRGGKSLVTLYPQSEGFVAQIVLGKDQAEKALSQTLGENVGKVLREAPQLHDGRWLFVNVLSETDVKDVEQLLRVKKRPVKQRKAPS